jgi:hypothetical protein
MDKAALFQALLQSFRAKVAGHEKAARAARDGATGDEVLSESKYDTRATESSYLARGHAMQYEAMLDDLRTLEAYRVPAYGPDEPIGTGALVELKLGRARSLCFLLPTGGGVEATVDGREVVAITARSPIGRALKGRRAGEPIELPDGGGKGTIVSVC